MINDKVVVKKINQDDILEILIEYFWEHELNEHLEAKGLLLGEAGKDHRFVAVFGETPDNELFNREVHDCNLIVLDKSTEFNGDH